MFRLSHRRKILPIASVPLLRRKYGKRNIKMTIIIYLPVIKLFATYSGDWDFMDFCNKRRSKNICSCYWDLLNSFLNNWTLRTPFWISSVLWTNLGAMLIFLIQSYLILYSFIRFTYNLKCRTEIDILSFIGANLTKSSFHPKLDLN